MNIGKHILAVVTGEPLAEAAKVSVASPQRGFRQGRTPADCALAIDCLPTAFSVEDERQPAAELPDIANAFPLLGHGWIHRFLEASGAPESFRCMIRSMYHGQTIDFDFDGDGLDS